MQRGSFEEVQVTRQPKRVSLLRLRFLAALFPPFIYNLVNKADTVNALRLYLLLPYKTVFNKD
jgi:hypothetical protein